MSELRGVLGFKGENGKSAYEIAVENGFVGTEQDWLNTLGTSSHFDEDKVIYTSTASQNQFLLPESYTSNSFIDVYVEGFRLNSDEYTVDDTNITLTNALEADNKVEIVVLTMSTNNLPIVETIASTSTNENVPGTKAVYDFTTEQVATIIDDTTASDTKAYSSNKVNSSIETAVASKLNKSNISVITGNIQNIASGASVTKDLSYPEGFTQSNTVIIGKMISSNNNYYDTADETITANGFPILEMISLNADLIRIWMKNTNQTQARNGYYKITLLKID